MEANKWTSQILLEWVNISDTCMSLSSLTCFTYNEYLSYMADCISLVIMPYHVFWFFYEHLVIIVFSLKHVYDFFNLLFITCESDNILSGMFCSTLKGQREPVNFYLLQRWLGGDVYKLCAYHSYKWWPTRDQKWNHVEFMLLQVACCNEYHQN